MCGVVRALKTSAVARERVGFNESRVWNKGEEKGQESGVALLEKLQGSQISFWVVFRKPGGEKK